MSKYFKEDKIIFRKADDFHTHPPGTYKAMIAQLSLEDGDYGISTRFVFETDFGEIWAFASGTELSPKNKLGKWMGAIFNVPVADLAEVNSADVIGRSCQIVVGPNEKGDVRVSEVLTSVAAPDGEQDDVPF